MLWQDSSVVVKSMDLFLWTSGFSRSSVQMWQRKAQVDNTASVKGRLLYFCFLLQTKDHPRLSDCPDVWVFKWIVYSFSRFYTLVGCLDYNKMDRVQKFPLVLFGPWFPPLENGCSPAHTEAPTDVAWGEPRCVLKGISYSSKSDRQPVGVMEGGKMWRIIC